MSINVSNYLPSCWKVAKKDVKYQPGSKCGNIVIVSNTVVSNGNML